MTHFTKESENAMNDLTTITNLITPEQNETAAIVFDALADNTKRAYQTNLTALRSWIGNDQLTDPKLCEYLQYAFDCGKSPASLRMICAAVQWLFSSTDQPSPVGKRSKAMIKKLSEAGADRGRGQAKPLTYEKGYIYIILALHRCESGLFLSQSSMPCGIILMKQTS